MNNEKKFIKLTPFKMQVLQSFPFIDEDFDAITNYELLCKVVEYLNKTVDNVDLLNEKIDEFQTYFDNLDVTEEINNKLDEMAIDGSLTELIKNYIDPIYENYESFINNKIENMENDIESQNESIDLMNTKVNTIASGSPLVATSISEMTDTDRLYVNTTDGNWYYYDGTEWVAGGIYQASVDSNLTTSIEKNLLNINFNGYIDINSQILNWEIGSINFDTGVPEDNTKRVRTSNFLKLEIGKPLTFSIEPGYYYNILYYNTPSDSGYVGNSQRINWTQDTLTIIPNYEYCKVLVGDNPVSSSGTNASIIWGSYFHSQYESIIIENKNKVDKLDSIIVEKSDNILDPSTFTYNTSNTVISDYIKIDGGNTYGFLIYAGYWQINTYDKYKNLLNTITVTASIYTANQIQTFDSNVAYIKLVVLTTNQNYSMCIKKGNTIPTYVPYSGYYYEFSNSKYLNEYDFSNYGLAYIEDNKLKANVWNNETQTAVYSCVDAGKNCYKMTCKGYWSNNTDNSTVAIISTKIGNKNSSDILTKSLHPVFTRTSVRVDFFDNSVKTSIYSEDYETPLVSGVEYTFGWEITSSNTIVITSATGSHTITMEGYNFNDYIGKYCILEHYNGNGNNQTGMISFTEWKAYDENNNVIVFDLYSKPNGVLSTTLNGLVYYQFSTHTGWRVTN